MKKNRIVWITGVLLCLLAIFPASAAKTGTLKLYIEDESNLSVSLYAVADKTGRLKGGFSHSGLTAEDILDTRLSDENAALLARYAKERNLPPWSKTTDTRGNVTFAGLPEGCYLILTPADTPPFDPFLVFVPTVVGNQFLYEITAEPKSDHPPTPPPGGGGGPGDPDDPDVPVDPDDPDTPVDPDDPDIPVDPDDPDIPVDPDDPDTPVDPDDPDIPVDPDDPDTPVDPDDPDTPDAPDEPGSPTEPEPEIPQTGVNIWPKFLLLALGVLCILLGCTELLRGRKEPHE